MATVSPGLQQQFMNYDWPGNVRQLENLVKRMIVLGTEAPILKDLQQPPPPLSFRSTAPAAAPSRAASPSQPTMPPAMMVPAPASLPIMPLSGARAGAGAAVAGAAVAGAGVGGAASSKAADDAMAEAVSAAVANTVGSGNVSLKDIARTAAREAERELILRMLTRTRWNRKEAAEILGISYKALLYKIKESGLDKAS